MTTAPVLGQPGPVLPDASPSGRTGIAAVPVAVVAVALVVGGLVAVPTELGLVLAGAGLTVLVGLQVTLWARQRRLTGALQRSQSSFHTLVKSSVDPVVILDDRLHITFTSPGIAVLTLLRDMGHRYLQGFVFARPLEAAQLTAGAWDVPDTAVLPAVRS